MKTFSALLLSAFVLGIGIAPAQAGVEDDMKWVNQCIKDNKGEGQSVEVVTKYCICMTDLMPESETASVTQWEKTHPKEEKMCDKQAGWKR